MANELNGKTMEKQIRRILIVDDNEAIHEDFKNILGSNRGKNAEMRSLENDLFGSTDESAGDADHHISYDIADAFQGEDAISMVTEAETSGDPYALVFMDVRMPPGMDGIQTIKKIWEKYPHIEMVICTAYSDYSWDEIITMFGRNDHLLFVKKPFISVEIKQIALTLTTKWKIDRDKRTYLADLEKNIIRIQKSKEILKKQEEEYRNLYETPVIGLFRIDKGDGRLLKANKTALNMFGYACLKDALEDDFKLTDYFPPEKVTEVFRILFQDRELNRCDVHFKFPDGREMDGAVNLKIRDKNNYIEGSILDTTEAKRSRQELAEKEKQLVQAQKMEIVGNLAGGLAHDFNNVLGGITGTVSLIELVLSKKEKLDEPTLRAHIDTIKESSSRATDMVKQLLSLSRKQELSLAPVDLNRSLMRVMKICINTFDKSVELNPETYTKKAMVLADPTRVEQAILNLCVNSAHAMTVMREDDGIYGGKLGVSIEKQTVGPQFCAANPGAVPGDYYCLTVSDTGVGMKPDIIGKIFEPFYTTKKINEGTGLGLAMVYNIIKQHTGVIVVTSEPGRGTEFKVFLPVRDDVSCVDGKGSEKVILPRGSGLILVVDDEMVLRQSAKAILEECGYRVMVAEDGLKALEIFKEKCKEIDAVLLDLSMPKMSGPDAYIKMKEICPKLKVVMTSGKKKEHWVDNALDVGVDDVIQKPYAMEKLAGIMTKLTG
ncbi:MAG: response regulator [bacterium]|nr:response regulator [bacterium]